jgi:DNA-3-methyladenine glycosylase II
MPHRLTHSSELIYSPPYDWESVLAYFRTHQIPYLETVDSSAYERVVDMRGGLGWFRVEHDAKRKSLLLSVSGGTREDSVEIAAQARRMFDLDAKPGVLRRAMHGDSYLAKLWADHPGLRVARSWNACEAMFGAVLGQVVSVKFGRVLMREVMLSAGTVALHPKTSEPISLFPSAKQIIEADLSSVRTSDTRRKTIRALAKAIETGALDPQTAGQNGGLRKTLRGVPGVGPWTTEYVAMRGFGDNDAFPATDYALKRELKQHPHLNVDAVRPWRSYAAVALWKSYAEAKGVAVDVVAAEKAPLQD